MTDTTMRQPSLLTRALHALPLVGALLRDAAKSDEALIFALLNAIMLWVIAGFVWGITGVLAVALVLAPTVLFSVCAMMLAGGKIS
ncbi:hypothetical protein [Kordiimonas gwangyangensis]|uniref:hypothetical protein n=1 Tax=Kordiimonas gwangyangensis TaxID=288022 RepID=UPI000371A407|nr:hypothetical protein [Kordiimonas gwangyangensis]